jgi:riboflavin biosynthesis pyrimidine reductase
LRGRVLSDRPSLHVHRLQGVAVLGPQRFENARQTLADVCRPIRLVADRSLRSELLVDAVARCVSTVIIDRRMTQDGVEP